ncbi:AAA family ATPase [uncultured Devosia sp.]|uniref:AAA family ATPase n=1 Tax=uncultured Devosia sp. TaxID=211434 RepID=UPI0035CB7486
MSETEGLDDVAAPEQHGLLWGHESARLALLDRLDKRRLPGAVLLHGPQGIGKATLAFYVSRLIIAATGDEDAHRVDDQVAAGAHPNLFVLRRTLNKAGTKLSTVITVDQVARRPDGDRHPLRDRLHQTRGRAGHRIAIIDSIDDCNSAAANALLKILEEPPADTTFFLISHRPGQLLPTIKSRCHSLGLRPLADADVRAVLASQRPDLASDQSERAVRLAGGRPRRAFETLALGRDTALDALQAWLTAPAAHPSSVHVKLAEALGADAQSPEMSFARELLSDWLAGEAHAAALQPAARYRLASANALWDKAQALLAEADSINLDAKQTLVAIFDAIRRHIETTTPVSIEP